MVSYFSNVNPLGGENGKLRNYSYNSANERLEKKIICSWLYNFTQKNFKFFFHLISNLDYFRKVKVKGVNNISKIKTEEIRYEQINFIKTEFFRFNKNKFEKELEIRINTIQVVPGLKAVHPILNHYENISSVFNTILYQTILKTHGFSGIRANSNFFINCLSTLFKNDTPEKKFFDPFSFPLSVLKKTMVFFRQISYNSIVSGKRGFVSKKSVKNMIELSISKMNNSQSLESFDRNTSLNRNTFFQEKFRKKVELYDFLGCSIVKCKKKHLHLQNLEEVENYSLYQSKNRFPVKLVNKFLFENQFFSKELKSAGKLYTKFGFLVKKAKDFTNEKCGSLFLSFIEKTLRENQVNIWISPYLIKLGPNNSLYMEILSRSLSIHSINTISKNKRKKGQFNNSMCVSKEKEFGKIVIESLAGYSLFCYLYQIKDRHNGNILLNINRAFLHIDFGFILNVSPGSFNFEASSFKMSKEFLSSIGGIETENYEKLMEIFCKAYLCLRLNFARVCSLSRLVTQEKKFRNSWKFNLKKFQNRYCLEKNDRKCIKNCISLFNESINDWRTLQYDRYQLYSSGIN